MTQEAAFLEYLQQYKKLIVKVARAYCNDPECRKDLIQDITVQLWKAFPKYDRNFALSTRTYRIALNVSISFLRKATTRKKTHSDYQQQIDLLQVDDAETQDNLAKLYRFIGQLKSIDKAMTILYLEGCTNKEIAEVMGISATNVSTKKSRILEVLKIYFENHKTIHI